MTTFLHNLFDLDDLEREIAAGMVNRRYHPDFPELALVGYADRTQFASHWTPTTMQARGVIYRTDTLEVLARPFRKFFNYGQGTAVFTPAQLDEPILGAWDKVDGSLGIRYTRPDGVDAIATRGSFDSEQARHASALLAADDGTAYPPFPNRGVNDQWTLLYEIVYPENRIVLDYGDLDSLVPLGAVAIGDGHFMPRSYADAAPHATLAEILAADPRPNAEGFVAWIDPYTAVKFKQDDYLALHRVVSNLTEKEVWRQLRAGTFDAFVVSLPDEFHAWAEDTARPLRDAFAAVWLKVDDTVRVMGSMPLPDRRAKALWLKGFAPDVMGYVFSFLDGKDYADSIWRSLEPKGA